MSITAETRGSGIPQFVADVIGGAAQPGEISVDPTDPRLGFDQFEIAKLRRSDPVKWRDTFFPEYAGLPMGAKRVYPNARISGGSNVPELTPWSNGAGPAGASVADIRAGRGKGPIDPIGVRMVGRDNGLFDYEPVPIAEYVAWCDSINFYRNGGVSPWNGGPGLDPATFAGGAWDIRVGRWLAEKKDPDFRQPILVESGVYFPHAGPTIRYPFGMNGAFFPKGSTVAIYVSDRWGPQWCDSHRVPRDEEPSQEDYDRMTTDLCLRWLP